VVTETDKSGSAPDAPLDDQIGRAIEALRHGGVVAIPTDTVYGLAASLARPDALSRIYAIKGRSGDKALPILISDMSQLARLAKRASPAALALAHAFWPGALTIVVPASDTVPDEVTRGVPTVGLRMPANDVALEVIRAAGGALAVTSANRSGEPEARTAAAVIERLGGRIAFVVDGGRSGEAPASTVVDASEASIRILRVGAISPEQIHSALAEAGFDHA